MSNQDKAMERANMAARKFRDLTALMLRQIEEHGDLTELAANQRGLGEEQNLHQTKLQIGLVQEHMRRTNELLRKTHNDYETAMRELASLLEACRVNA